MLPIFTYLMPVLIHSPTPEMFFYSCPNQGTVIDYSHYGSQQEGKFLVELKCPGGRTVVDWIPQGNLAAMDRSK